MTTSLVHIATITSAHGIRGEVKLRSFANPAAAVFTYKAISDATGKRAFTLKKRGVQGEMFIAAIDGIATRNDAELLKNVELYTAAEALPKPTKGWSYDELTGLAARLENGQPYGVVKQLYNFGAGDIIEIEKPDGTLEMLPFNNRFVGDVHPRDGYVVVFPPDYVEL